MWSSPHGICTIALRGHQDVGNGQITPAELKVLDGKVLDGNLRNDAKVARWHSAARLYHVTKAAQKEGVL